MIWAIFLITIFSEKKIVPVAGCSHLFFSTHNGKHYTQIYCKICQAFNINNISMDELPVPSAHRVKVTTKSLKKLNQILYKGRYTNTYATAITLQRSIMNLLMMTNCIQ